MRPAVTLRFYAELNDHLSDAQGEVVCHVDMAEPVGRLIENCGVPLASVDLIVVGGESVGADHRVSPGDRVGVYPVFEAFDIGPEAKLPSRPLRVTRFLVEADLAPLAGLLRESGFDAVVCTASPSGWGGSGVGRIVLTTDPTVVAGPGVTHALVVTGDDPAEQAEDLAARLHLSDPDTLGPVRPTRRSPKLVGQ